jgi:hypothetical protein
MPDKEQESGQTALKKLKAARKEQIAAATARMKEQRRAVKAIKKHLEGAESLVCGHVKEIRRNSGRAQGWGLLSLPARPTLGFRN